MSDAYSTPSSAGAPSDPSTAQQNQATQYAALEALMGQPGTGTTGQQSPFAGAAQLISALTSQPAAQGSSTQTQATGIDTDSLINSILGGAQGGS